MLVWEKTLISKVESVRSRCVLDVHQCHRCHPLFALGHSRFLAGQTLVVDDGFSL